MTLLQNATVANHPVPKVSLPVRVTLLQNTLVVMNKSDWFHYQSG